MRANAPALATAASLLFVLLCLAPAASADVVVTASIGNVAPVVVSITLSGASLSGGVLAPTAGTTSSITATVVASDTNGGSDISGITVGIIKPDGSTVQIAQAAATLSSTNGLLATYTKTLAMNYYDAPATGGSTYKVKATVTDAGALAATNALTMATFGYSQLVALSAPSTFALSANAGSSSSATALSVNNYGNMQIDTQVSGTDLTYGGTTIAVGDITYSLTSGMASPAALTGSAATIGSYDLAPASGAAKDLYFKLTPTTPANGLPAGDYTGTLTVTAVSG
jgi:hypothetical protein